MEKLVYIKTYGCQMNVRDSEQMIALLERCGYRETQKFEEARLILVNTCSVREKPEQKAYSAVGRFQRLKRWSPGVILGVAGCVAQQEGERLLTKFPALDFVVGPGKIHRLPEVLSEVESARSGLCEVGFEDHPYADLPLSRDTQLRAYVTIMEGCDNFCSYCIVPHVRGRERSRPSDVILAEITALVEEGAKEITLLGQNVNSYAKHNPDELTFPFLLARINEIQGLERIRFTTSHPRDLTEELIESFGRLERLCEHIHLPFQAGSNRVLEKMGRGYTREEYVAKIRRLREVVPEISITADAMVGFPGEGDEDFAQTLELLQKVEFDSLFSFKYFPRKGTAAARCKDDVPPELKQQRLEVLQNLQRKITLKKNRALEGEVREVLVEGRSRNSPHEIMGRTRCNRIVNCAGGSEMVGALVRVEIDKGLFNSLRGRLCR